LPAERIAHEMRRLIAAPGAAETARCMQEASILQIVLGGIGYVAQLRRAIAFEIAAGLAPGVPRRLAALSARIVEDVDRVATRLRLSNAERGAMLAGVMAASRLTGPPAGFKAREQLYRLGGSAFADGLAQAAAMGVGDPSLWAEILAATKDWIPPRFPLTGGDLTAAGLAKGPAIGAFLKELEEWWIAEGFSPDRAALLNRLQQMAAGQQ
jgi:tRNA nucleotidyltransferase/poly(A) polymerase